MIGGAAVGVEHHIFQHRTEALAAVVADSVAQGAVCAASSEGGLFEYGSDAAIVVTEHGIADLRALTLAQRVRRMIAIAHPQDREALEFQARQLGLPGAPPLLLRGPEN